MLYTRPIDTVVAYTFQAELLCPSCTLTKVQGPDRDPWVGVEHQLFLAARARGIDYEDESTYDSDDFPKVVFVHQLERDEVCADCGGEL